MNEYTLINEYTLNHQDKLQKQDTMFSKCDPQTSTHVSVNPCAYVRVAFFSKSDLHKYEHNSNHTHESRHDEFKIWISGCLICEYQTSTHVSLNVCVCVCVGLFCKRGRHKYENNWKHTYESSHDEFKMWKWCIGIRASWMISVFVQGIFCKRNINTYTHRFINLCVYVFRFLLPKIPLHKYGSNSRYTH